MQSKIQKWGNSQGLRLNKGLLQDIQAKVGDAVEVYSQDGKIIIEPIRQERGKYNLESLVREIPAEYQVEETDWGQPQGKEEW